MALEIFKLVGSVFVDTDKANDSLQKTDKKASSFASTLGGVAKGAGVAALAIGGAVAAVGTGVMKVATDVSESADEIDKASIRMGISTDAYQELAYAAGQCGVEMSTMESAAKKLEGTDLSFDDAISQIMELSTAEERSAAAAELFGEKVAYNLSPLIEQSGDDFDALTQRAHELGLVMSEDAVKGGVQFGDLMSDLKQSLGSLANAIGSELFPILISMIDGLLSFMPQMQSYMQMIAPILADMVSAVLPVLFALLDALLPVAIEIVEAILPLLLELIDALLPLITALIPLIEPISQLLMAILVPLVQFLSDILPPLINAITYIVNGLVPFLISAIQLVAGALQDYINIILNFVKPFIQTFIDLFNGLGKFFTGVFTGNWKMAWEGILDIMKSYVNGIIRAINAFINLFVDSINTIINSAKRLANLVPGVNFDTSVSVVPRVDIPLLAKGGVIEESGQAIVGEAGAELLSLPKGAKVSPLPQNDFDYDKLTDSLVNALKETLQITIPVNIGNEYLETIVVDALQTANYRSGGR